jgi:hypothetical protein
VTAAIRAVFRLFVFPGAFRAIAVVHWVGFAGDVETVGRLAIDFCWGGHGAIRVVSSAITASRPARKQRTPAVFMAGAPVRKGLGKQRPSRESAPPLWERFQGSFALLRRKLLAPLNIKIPICKRWAVPESRYAVLKILTVKGAPLITVNAK